MTDPPETEPTVVTALETLQSLIASIGEELAETGAVADRGGGALNPILNRQRQAADDLAGLVQACQILQRRRAQL